MKSIVKIFILIIGLSLLMGSCKKDEVTTKETPSLIGSWICTNISGETYKLNFTKDNAFVMIIAMTGNSVTMNGNYAYDETIKTISYTVKSPSSSSLVDYKNVTFNSVSQWQASVNGALLIWNK